MISLPEPEVETIPAAGPERVAVLLDRVSTRDLASGQLDDSLVTKLLEAAIRAPSAHNAQPWRLVVVRPGAGRERLATRLGQRLLADLLADGVPGPEAEERATQARRRLTEAPLAIVVCTDHQVSDGLSRRHREIERTMAVQGSALAAGWLLLAAHFQGLAGCWYSAPLYAPGAVRQALGLPRAWAPQAMVLIGRPAHPPRRRTRRRALAEVAAWR